MKWLLCSVPMFALLFASCSAPNNTTVLNSTISDSTAPTITGFSPDTVWTLKLLTVRGHHFGYDSADLSVTINNTQASASNAYDSVLTINVPDSAQSGFIHIASINGSCTSAKPVVVEHTFHPDSINDSIREGASFSIPGTGMKNYHGFIALRVGSFPFPIDSIFDNRIVSHIIPDGTSGEMFIYDSIGSYDCGNLSIIRRSAWNTLSAIWDNWTVSETHHRTGFSNGVRIDSSWTTTVTFSRQQDFNVSGTPFVKSGEWLQYHLQTPNLQMTWDTIAQTANVQFSPPESTPTIRVLSVDTLWYGNYSNNTPARLPVDGDIELTMPTFGYQITEDSADASGLVNWDETTTGAVLSGAFDLILKQ